MNSNIPMKPVTYLLTPDGVGVWAALPAVPSLSFGVWFGDSGTDLPASWSVLSPKTEKGTDYKKSMFIFVLNEEPNDNLRY